MSAVIPQPATVYRATPHLWMLAVVVLAVLYWTFHKPLHYLFNIWATSEEYSYGYLIPFLVAFLIWQKTDLLNRKQFSGSWQGVAVVLCGVLCYFLGVFSTIPVIELYGFIIIIFGLALSYVGFSGFGLIAIPLLMLLFMVPLPQFLLTQLSAQFQLISSELGVLIIRLFGISVFLEGNVIDLGTYKLQVVEACSGLRYLFPLMVFGFILAYFYKTALWKRLLIFLSTIPITIFMNSLRIGIIGVTVEYWGVAMAEGFLHDFEGWVIFMACTAVLIVEMWLLTRLGNDRRPLKQVFGLELPAKPPRDAAISRRNLPMSLKASSAILLVLAILAAILPHRQELIPERISFGSFPLRLDDWAGRDDRLEQIYVDALKFTDYLLIDYANRERQQVNLYVAYYGSQKSGESAHSPRSCLPGGGWEITSLSQARIDGIQRNGRPLSINRAVIEKNDHRQLVYYWFQQRGRVITNEYLVKLYLFWDALTLNRTDGALVRLSTIVDKEGSVEESDRIMQSFVASLLPHLEPYIPD